MATPKQKALISALGAGLSGFVAFIANSPPSQQAGLLAALIECVPVDWRPNVAAAGKLISEFALVYGMYQASHSGPSTKPATDTQTGEAVPVAGNTIKTQRLTP